MKQNAADFVDCFQLNLMNRKVEQAMLKKNVDEWTGVLNVRTDFLKK